MCVDDGSAEDSAGSPDQSSMMEVRLQAQEDEITLLKSSLADALRKLQLHDQLLHLLKQQLVAGKLPQRFTSYSIVDRSVESDVGLEETRSEQTTIVHKVPVFSC